MFSIAVENWGFESWSIRKTPNLSPRETNANSSLYASFMPLLTPLARKRFINPFSSSSSLSLSDTNSLLFRMFDGFSSSLSSSDSSSSTSISSILRLLIASIMNCCSSSLKVTQLALLLVSYKHFMNHCWKSSASSKLSSESESSTALLEWILADVRRVDNKSGSSSNKDSLSKTNSCRSSNLRFRLDFLYFLSYSHLYTANMNWLMLSTETEGSIRNSNMSPMSPSRSFHAMT
ncbi:hypothetical protein OGATHE_006421 [Ogataea polymorpha]|uniref:Uncharacterized protein n=1 Tax=Ogataea polymorpha TaxID=460523 RepID=A0A9P8NRT4_9ASCO|nr:hypothetical protein OGATHE_006421 [Ogataea polymorpha]